MNWICDRSGSANDSESANESEIAKMYRAAPERPACPQNSNISIISRRDVPDENHAPARRTKHE
jgi:hypothetical protein